MANLTPEEYVKIQFSDTYDTYDIIRIVRIHSPNSHWKKNAQVFLWIIKIGKKDIYTSVFLTTDYESDGTTYKKNNYDNKYFLSVEDSVVQRNVKSVSKSEMKNIISDKEKQNSLLNDFLGLVNKNSDDGTWVITQDPWDPNVLPPENTPPIVEPVKPIDVDPIQPVVVDEATIPPKYQPIKLQDDFNFDVTNDKKINIISGMQTNSDNLVTLPDGTKIDLGSLLLIKQEDPFDPEILKILSPQFDSTLDEPSEEYTESDFNGLFSADDQLELDKIDQTPRTNNSVYLENTPIIEGTYIGSKGLNSIKSLIASHESAGSYDIYNIGKSGAKGISYALKPTTKTIGFIKSKQATNEMFAVGKYQFIPITLLGVQNGLGLKDNVLFDENTQEQFIEHLLFKVRKLTGNYIKGKNSGTEKDLSKAVQELSKEFSSFPTIESPKGKFYGNVATGEGNKSYYGGVGINPTIVKTSVKTICIMLIQTRIAYSGKKPSFIPNYYTANA